MEKEAGNTDVFILSSFARSCVCVTPVEETITSRDGGNTPRLPLSCVDADPRTVAAAVILYLQHATVSFKPETNQDKRYRLTQNHSADWVGGGGGVCSLEEWHGEIQEVLYSSSYDWFKKQWKLWSMKLNVPVWHGLNKYLLLFTCKLQVPLSTQSDLVDIESSRKFYWLQFNDFK